MTKFNVTIQADETTLGPVLASLPQGVVPEIIRLKERRPTPPQKLVRSLVRSVVNGGTKSDTKSDAKSDAKSATLIDVLADIPAEFSGRDFRESLSRNKLHPVSANYYLKRLRQRKLIHSTGIGTAMRYHKIKGD